MVAFFLIASVGWVSRWTFLECELCWAASYPGPRGKVRLLICVFMTGIVEMLIISRDCALSETIMMWLASACRDKASLRHTGYAKENDNFAVTTDETGSVVIGLESIGLLPSESVVIVGSGTTYWTILNDECFFWQIWERIALWIVTPMISATPSHLSPSLHK